VFCHQPCLAYPVFLVATLIGAFILLAFFAGLAIKFYRTGVLW
jgi:hypothetical protein